MMLVEGHRPGKSLLYFLDAYTILFLNPDLNPLFGTSIVWPFFLYSDTESSFSYTKLGKLIVALCLVSLINLLKMLNSPVSCPL